MSFWVRLLNPLRTFTSSPRFLAFKFANFWSATFLASILSAARSSWFLLSLLMNGFCSPALRPCWFMNFLRFASCSVLIPAFFLASKFEAFFIMVFKLTFLLKLLKNFCFSPLLRLSWLRRNPNFIMFLDRFSAILFWSVLFANSFVALKLRFWANIFRLLLAFRPSLFM